MNLIDKLKSISGLLTEEGRRSAAELLRMSNEEGTTISRYPKKDIIEDGITIERFEVPNGYIYVYPDKDKNMLVFSDTIL